ncbi:TetR family transcriptional regulator [Mycetocola reblochoni REB411]|uniref:TetR family transcriptional regulator n=3 Tax=Mycetocola reblochoni TaxID=331618 RepID=A0A1R4KCA8_9MICO|nr:TetR family transcriptional regulator [Mycetocola reblochoni REB411]
MNMDGHPSGTGSPGRRQRNSEQRRAAILAAASRIFVERGYESAGTQEIAAAAGLAHGTIFRYAPSKAELFLTVYNEEFAVELAALESALAAVEPGDTAEAEGAVLIVDGLLGWLDRHGDNARAYQREILYGSRTAEAVAEARVLVERCVGLIAAHIAGHRSGVDALAVSLARLFFVGSQLDPEDLLAADTPAEAADAAAEIPTDASGAISDAAAEATPADGRPAPSAHDVLVEDLRLLRLGHRAGRGGAAPAPGARPATTDHRPSAGADREHPLTKEDQK